MSRVWRATAGLALLVLAISAAGCGNGVDEQIEAAGELETLPVYWLGKRFEDWDLEHVETGDVGVTLIYGKCETSGDSGCAPPLVLQVLPLCYHLYEAAANRTWERRSIRGAPVGRFDDAPVMFTRRAMIKAYWGQGADSTVVLRALADLRSLNDVPPRIGPDGPIPPPAAGVLEGTSPCSA